MIPNPVHRDPDARVRAALAELGDALSELTRPNSDPSPTAPVDLVAPAEFARRAGLSRSTTYLHLATGEIRSVKLGGRRLAHLSTRSKRLWRDLTARYSGLEPHRVELLRLACEALDRAAEARAIIAAEGLMLPGRGGPRLHPAANLERDSRLAAARLLRESGFDLVDPDTARPPSRYQGHRP